MGRDVKLFLMFFFSFFSLLFHSLWRAKSADGVHKPQRWSYLSVMTTKQMIHLVAWLGCSWLSPWKSTQIIYGENIHYRDNEVHNNNNNNNNNNTKTNKAGVHEYSVVLGSYWRKYSAFTGGSISKSYPASGYDAGVLRISNYVCVCVYVSIKLCLPRSILMFMYVIIKFLCSKTTTPY